MTDIVIKADNLGVRYRRYHKKVTTLKDSVVSFFQGSQFESFWAVRNLSLEVTRGERFGILGRNGSGKSTLLRTMSGILKPGEGSVEATGRLVPLLELGGGFMNSLTGRENVLLSGAIMGMTRKESESRVSRIADFAEVGDFIDSPLSAYSSGMKSRLGFAVATDINPDILLLDEVFAVGDAEFRHKAEERIMKFFKEGRTVVMVSHNLGQLERLCDRCMWLDAGQSVEVGEPTKTIKNYRQETAKKRNTKQ